MQRLLQAVAFLAITAVAAASWPCGTTSYCVFDATAPCPRQGRCHGNPQVSCGCDDTLDVNACHGCSQSWVVNTTFEDSGSYSGAMYPLAGTEGDSNGRLSFESSVTFADVVHGKHGPYLLEHKEKLTASAWCQTGGEGSCGPAMLNPYRRSVDTQYNEWLTAVPENANISCSQDLSTCSLAYSRPAVTELSDFGTMRRYTWWTNMTDGKETCVCSAINQELYKDLGVFSHDAERWLSTATSLGAAAGADASDKQVWPGGAVVLFNKTEFHPNYPAVHCIPYKTVHRVVDANYTRAPRDRTTGVDTALTGTTSPRTGCDRYSYRSDLETRQSRILGLARAKDVTGTIFKPSASCASCDTGCVDKDSRCGGWSSHCSSPTLYPLGSPCGSSTVKACCPKTCNNCAR